MEFQEGVVGGVESGGDTELTSELENVAQNDDRGAVGAGRYTQRG